MALEALTVRSTSDDQERSIFLTAESLTFPGVTAAASLLLQLAEVQFKGARTSLWWALGICGVLGGAIYWFSLKPGMSGDAKGKGAFIAFLNTLLLTASALGVSSLAAQDAPRV